jgi:hypothetical protein
MLVPQRNHAQALRLSARQGILQELLCKVLALQIELTALQSAACLLNLFCPDLWRILRHFPHPLDITGSGRQLDSV